MITQEKFSDESKMPRIPVSWEKKKQDQGIAIQNNLRDWAETIAQR